MVAWPASLAAKQYEPITFETIDNRIITTMDNGAIKMRRRVSANPRRFSVGTFLDGAELETFLNFYDDTIKGGVLPFDWQNPITDVTTSLKFQPSKRPPWDFTLIVGAVLPANRVYQGTFHLEHA